MAILFSCPFLMAKYSLYETEKKESVIFKAMFINFEITLESPEAC